MSEDIGGRMKTYESNRRLSNDPIIIRIDGKSFHNWTKSVNAKRPYDELVANTMVASTRLVADQMQGFKLAYSQSDEATFLLTNSTEKDQHWFGGKLDKLVSITASMFTYHFNRLWGPLAASVSVSQSYNYKNAPAFFDARAFNIPLEDAANCFYWRYIDWKRNSVIMLGRDFFSHKEMQGKSTSQVKEMLLDIGASWENQNDWIKYGTFYTSYGTYSGQVDYYLINELAGISVT
jgi:tRNA(His) guanylyltransferase